ncbi:MAG: hypothetical protein ACOYO1_09620 [Bacteroidales bacterium]
MITYILRTKKLVVFLVLTIFSIVTCEYFIIAFLKKPDSQNEWIFIAFLVFFLVLFSAPIYLTVTYLFEDFNKSVTLDNSSSTIILRKRKTEIKISQNDIVTAYHVLVDKDSKARYRQTSFEYIILVLKERKRFIVTNLICEPLTLLKFIDIACKTTYYNIPLIDRDLGSEILTSEEYSDKVKEFEKNFRNHSTQELIKIINDKQSFIDSAREAAKNILSLKKNQL